MASKRRRTRAAATTRKPPSSGGRSTWVVFLAGLIVGACGAVVAQNSNLPAQVLALVSPGPGGASQAGAAGGNS